MTWLIQLYPPFRSRIKRRVCVYPHRNFLHLAERIFKVEVVEEVRRIATFLCRNQSNIGSHGANIVAPLTLWVKLRVACEFSSISQSRNHDTIRIIP